MGRNHAEHNRDCCNSLFSDGKFNDWVVTTAFYASLHFVSYEIFPFTLNGKKYLDLDDYYRQLPNPKQSKHVVLVDLVRRKVTSIKGQYKWLYDNCMSARYKNYLVSSQNATKAKKYMDDIEKAFIKPS